MKHITRIDNETQNYWVVRIGKRQPWGIQKYFHDKQYKNRSSLSLAAAKKFHAKEVNRLKPKLDKLYSKVNGQRMWGRGWHEQWITRGDYQYLIIVAYVWDKKTGTVPRKSFSVLQRGYDEAVRLAEQWRKSKLGINR